MDPVTVVVAALVAGAAAGASNVVSTAIMDAYQALKTLTLNRLRRGGVIDNEAETLLAGAPDEPAGRAALTGELARVGVDQDTVDAANRLLELLDKPTGKFVVDASQAKGVIIGDHSTQTNTFN